MPRDRSVVLPETIQLNTTTWNCGDISVSWTQIPSAWVAQLDLADADLADADGSPVNEEGYGTISFRDTIHAIYSETADTLSGPDTTPPDDVEEIQALTAQLAKDWYSWRLEAFDFVYNGVVAPQIDGYIDEILWTFRSEKCETRVKSRPWDDYTEFYNHALVFGDCPNCLTICESSGSNTSITAEKLCYDPITGGLYKTTGTGNCCCPNNVTSTCVTVITVNNLCTGENIATVTVTVVTTVTDGIRTVSVTITGEESGVDVSTDSSGGLITVNVGDCTYEFQNQCNPVTLYYCTASVDYSSIGIGGGDPSVTYVASGGTVVSMTGGSPTGLGGPGSWSSMTPGTAVFCYLGPTVPGESNFCGTCSGYGYGYGGYAIGCVSTVHEYNCGFISPDPDFWETCTPPQVACCCNPNSVIFVYYSKATYVASGCDNSVCSTIGVQAQGCVGPNNALPKTLCATVVGPNVGDQVGGLSDEEVTFFWVSGDGSYCDGFPIVYSSICLGANGAGAHCISTTECEVLGQKTVVGEFVPYQSHIITLTLFCLGGITNGSLIYTNFWNGGCVLNDPCPKICLDDTTCPPPGDNYCPTEQICIVIDGETGLPVTTTSDSYLQYPMNLTFQLEDGDAGFFACVPLMPWENVPCAIGGPCWASGCHNVDDPSFGDVASCVVDLCVDDGIELLDLLRQFGERKNKSLPELMEMIGKFGESNESLPRSFDGKVHVGILSPCCYLGGAERWISDLLDLCDESKIQWVGIATKDCPNYSQIVMDDWTAHCPVTQGWSAMGELARSVDVLLTWGVLDVPWGLPPKMVDEIIPKGLPVIVVSHGSMDPPDTSNQTLPKAVAVAVSRTALNGLPKRRREGARIILNTVPPERVVQTRSRADMLEEWGLPADAKIAGWLGRMSPEKGPDRFIRAVSKLPTGWYGVMAGWSPNQPRYQGIADREATGRIKFLGPRTDVGNVLGAYDRFVMTSETEGCSLALIEGILAEVPAVCTRVGMLSDESRLARPLPDEPDAERDAAIIMEDWEANDTAERVSWAKAYALREFSPDRFSREWTELFVSLSRPIPNKEICNCGNDIWVGSAKACEQQGIKFNRIVHVYRDDNGGSVCTNYKESENNLLLHWREYDPIEPIDLMTPSLDTFMEFARRPGKLLVHCYGGVTRSTTLAVAAKIVRGCDPQKAMRDVEAAMIRDRGIPVAWHKDIVMGIVEKFQKEQVNSLGQLPGHPPIKTPGLLQKATSFATTVTKQYVAGNPKVSKEIEEERRAICFGCDQHDHKIDKCNKCGCSGNKLAWKRSMATVSCPINKWIAVTT